MEKKFRKKYILDKILFVETPSRYHYPYQNWFIPLSKICKKIICFDYRRENLLYGKNEMNKRLLDIVEKEKPDIALFWLIYDEYNLETFLKIKEISPLTKTIVFFGDDDTQFDNFSRYYALFFDYCLIAQPKYVSLYRQEGIKNVFPTIGVNIKNFKPLGLKKLYDITFIGHPRPPFSGRYETIKYLTKNKVNIRLFGLGWDNYPEFEEIYKGPLDNKEIVKVINQTKINLCFSKNHYDKPQIKGRLFEIPACKSFQLVEYAREYLEYFKEGKEVVMFKNKKDLLKKIKYYLEHEEERENIAEAAYKKVIKNHDIEKELQEILKKINKDNKDRKRTCFSLPRINKKIIILSEKDLELGFKKIKEKLKNSDYVCFDIGKSKILPFREYLQAYSLEKSKKQISCCDYYVYSPKLGNYLAFHSYLSFKIIKRKDFEKLLDINQLMVKKSYFLKYFTRFKKAFKENKINFLNRKTTIFVSIPLVEIEDIKIYDYAIIKKAFDLKFLYNLYSLLHKNKRKGFCYLSSLMLEILKGKRFIFTALLETITSKDKWRKLKSLEGK